MTVFLPNAFLIIENCRSLRDCSRNCLTLGLKTCVVVTGDQRSYFFQEEFLCYSSVPAVQGQHCDMDPVFLKCVSVLWH